MDSVFGSDTGWEKTPQYQKLVFRHIETANWRQLERPDIWPIDIAWIREAFVHDWHKWTANDQATLGYAAPYADLALTASPRFFVAQDGELLASASGGSGWRQSIKPELTRLLGP